MQRAPFFAHLGSSYASVSLTDDARAAMVPDRLSAPALRTTIQSLLTPTIDAAASAFLSREWTDFRHEVGNLLGEAVQRVSSKRYNSEWNKVVHKVSSQVREISREKARSFPGDSAEDDIAWDLLGACCEIHFNDIVPSGLFTLMSGCYLQGFLPFGWKGDFPNGCLLVCTDGTPLTQPAAGPGAQARRTPAARKKPVATKKPASKKKAPPKK